MRIQILKSLVTAAAMAILTVTANSQQGVTEDEVLIGSNGDLSGVFAPFNVQAIKAAQLIFDEVNKKGGIHGRQIRFIVEDHTYQMPKALANFNKLINSDGVFAMVLNLGTPMNIAGFPLMESKKIANVSPLSGARQMLEGDIAYKYSVGSSYYTQILRGIDYLVDKNGGENICSMYLPTDFGKEIYEAAVFEAKELGKTFAAETTHKPDESDFVGALTKLRDAGCDIVTTALTVRQTIVTVATAKKLGWTDVSFLGSSAAFHEAIALQPGGITEGYYATSGWADYKPRLDDPEVKSWYDAFKAKYGDEEPGMAAILGNSAALTLVKALEAAGKDLTPESFQAGMESLSFRDAVADVDVQYGPGDHNGAQLIVISVVENGVFKEVGRL